MHALLDSGKMSLLDVARLSEEEGLGLRQSFGKEGDALLGPEEAMFW